MAQTVMLRRIRKAENFEAAFLKHSFCGLMRIGQGWWGIELDRKTQVTQKILTSWESLSNSGSPVTTVAFSFIERAAAKQSA